jgi:hypothetical protein
LPSSLLGYPDYGALVVGRGNYFQFDLVFIKKNNQTEFFLKKTETEPNPIQTDWFQFSF